MTARAPRIAIADVGQSRFEELDYTTRRRAPPAPTSAGTRSRGSPPTGTKTAARPDPGGTVKPIFAYSHSRGGSCTIIGGYVVADRRLPSLRGRYVYADYCEGRCAASFPT